MQLVLRSKLKDILNNLDRNFTLFANSVSSFCSLIIFLEGSSEMIAHAKRELWTKAE